MQDLLAGNQPKIEGSTMTNETTASQPKSIGDDAQFLQLLTAVETAPRYSKELSEASAALIIAIDSKLRAPAAHASATIQAAPDAYNAALEEAAQLIERGQETDVINGEYGESNVKTITPRRANNLMGLAYAAGIRALKSTTTIQEPVMVAEPVTHELMQHLGTMRAVFHTNMLRAYPEKSHAEIAAEIDRALGAAPMVADPAGVAFDREEFIRQVSVSIAEMDRDSPEGQPEMMLVTPQELQNVMRNTFGSFDEDAELALAATVKAVPSEALDAARLRWLIEDHDDAKVREKARELAGRLGTSSYFAITRDIDVAMKIAAPLADKTGASGEKA